MKHGLLGEVTGVKYVQPKTGDSGFIEYIVKTNCKTCGHAQYACVCQERDAEMDAAMQFVVHTLIAKENAISHLWNGDESDRYQAKIHEEHYERFIVDFLERVEAKL